MLERSNAKLTVAGPGDGGAAQVSLVGIDAEPYGVGGVPGRDVLALGHLGQVRLWVAVSYRPLGT